MDRLAMNSDDLGYVRQELSEIYKPEGVEIWLNSPHKLLSGRRAIECPAEDVLRLIEQLQTGTFT